MQERSSSVNYPKISIVTPCFNMAEYLEETLKSVLLQQYPNLEYIIIDGGSKDRTVEIIKKYEKYISYWISEKDEGMYHALQKGFEHSTGDIMGWLNADDILHPYSLFTLAELFTRYEHVDWLQGINCIIDQQGRAVHVIEPKNTTRYAFLLKNFLNEQESALVPSGTIQQESTYWRRSLWNKSGERIDATLGYAGDFELWMRFFRYEPLVIAKTLIGAFRYRPGQLSSAQDKYIEEALTIIDRETGLLNPREKRLVEMLRLLEKRKVLRRIPGMNSLHRRYFTSTRVSSSVNYYEN